MTRLFLLLVTAACLLVGGPGKAQGFVGGGLAGGTVFRREVQEDRGDFRFTAELFATSRDRQPYWGYLAVSQELLKCPNVGMAEFGFVLVTPDGKAVQEAKYSEDHTKEYKDWQDLRLENGRWILPYNLEGIRAGTRTVFFAGKIRKGKGSYTKLFILLEITIGKRKDLRQADALQFMVYDLPLRDNQVDPQLLANVQTAMGAGGSSLIGPAIEDNGSVGSTSEPSSPEPRPEPRPQPARSQPPAGRYLPIIFDGFAAYARVEWDSGQSEELYIQGRQEVRVPDRASSFRLYILSRKGEEGVRVRWQGKDEPIPADLAEVRVSRTARR